MAEKYVDLNATGAGNGLTPADAWTTIELAEAGAVAGDNINVAAGSYLESDGVFNAVNSVKQLTWLGTGTVVVSSASTSWVTIFTSNDVSSFDNFTFDGTGDTEAIIRANTAGNNLTVKNCVLTGVSPTGNIYTSANTTTTNVLFDNVTIDGTSNNNVGAFNLTNNFSVQILNSTITGSWDNIALHQEVSEFNFNGNTVNFTQTRNISAFSASNSILSTVNNNNITVQSDATVSASLIDANKSTDIEISGNIIDLTLALANREAILVRSNDAGSYPGALVDNNTVTSLAAAGQVIIIGTDLESIGDNSLDGGVISNNTITGPGATGGLHGIEMGYNIGDVSYNEVRTCVYGVVMKGISDYLGQEGCRFNLLKNCTGSASVRLKGYKNCPIVGNTIYVNDGGQVTNGLIHSTVNTESANTPSSMQMYNQIIMSETSPNAGRVVFIETGSETNNLIGGNLYYIPNSNLAFQISTTTYANITDWNAVISGTDFEGDPLFVDAPNGNFELQAGSAAIGIGVKYWGNDPRPVSANGEPLPDVQIDAGMNQSLHSINHPGNPNFVPL